MRIKELRVERNMTQAHIASLIGIRQSAVAMWENGQTVPKLEHIVKLAEIFDCSVDELISIYKE